MAGPQERSLCAWPRGQSGLGPRRRPAPAERPLAGGKRPLVGGSAPLPGGELPLAGRELPPEQIPLCPGHLCQRRVQGELRLMSPPGSSWHLVVSSVSIGRMCSNTSECFTRISCFMLFIVLFCVHHQMLILCNVPAFLLFILNYSFRERKKRQNEISAITKLHNCEVAI